MNAEQLIKTAERLGAFQCAEDGFIYYEPPNNGLIAAWELRVLADELDRRNADWKSQINKESEVLK